MHQTLFFNFNSPLVSEKNSFGHTENNSDYIKTILHLKRRKTKSGAFLEYTFANVCRPSILFPEVSI